MYNVWDFISRYIPLVKCLRLSRKGLMVGVLARFLFLPAFYFTAKYGDQGWMLMLTSLLGVSNGYLTVCVLTDAPKGYKVFRNYSYYSFEILSFISNLCLPIFIGFVGARAKCLGKFACTVSSGWHICRCSSWLAVAHW